MTGTTSKTIQLIYLCQQIKETKDYKKITEKLWQSQRSKRSSTIMGSV